jgi:adenylate kinase
MSEEKTPKRHKAFIIVGAPGAGKGTQGAIIGEIPRFLHFSTGDAFRRLDTRSEIGQEFVRYSSSGELVPDELTVRFCEEQIEAKVDSGGYKPDIDMLLLDGIPRNRQQAELLEEQIEMIALIHLSCPDREELVRRLRKRALKSGRMDDASEEVIRQRIQTYEEETKQLLDYYPASRVRVVNAMQPPIKVAWDVLAAVMTLPEWQEMSREVV